MKCNVGKSEQAIRIGFGILLVLAGLYYNSWWGLFGLLPITTGLIRYCPVSDILGVSTCGVDEE